MEEFLPLLNIFSFLSWKKNHYLWPLKCNRGINFRQRADKFPEPKELRQDSSDLDLYFGADIDFQSTLS